MVFGEAGFHLTSAGSRDVWDAHADDQGMLSRNDGSTVGVRGLGTFLQGNKMRFTQKCGREYVQSFGMAVWDAICSERVCSKSDIFGCLLQSKSAAQNEAILYQSLQKCLCAFSAQILNII